MIQDRIRQFREASLQPNAEDLELAQKLLDEPILSLFLSQNLRDQRHGARTAHWLISKGENNSELLIAALIHDIGKGHQRTRDRVVHVLTSWSKTGKLVEAKTSSFEMRQAIARSRNHSELGAQQLKQSGVSNRVIELTRLHHTPPETDTMLALLQCADSKN
tara:strand:+ start:484 stop:969 length:486 start_codon:yes stop_codon:yes gene_type:complete